MITKRQFLAGSLGAAALAVSARGASAQEVPKEFRVGFQKSSGILVTARQQQALEKHLKPLGVENVKWIEFQFGPPLLEALGSGSVDIGTVGDTPPIFAQAAGANLLYVASAPATQNATLVQKDSPIKTVADLKGKKVAFAKGSSSHNFIVQALKKNGLRYTDIEPVFLAPADAAAAFASNRVDAWTVWDPYYALAQKRHDARAIVTTADGLPSHSFYLANKGLVERSPRTVQGALDALREVTAWAAQNRDKVAALTSELTGVEYEAQKIATDRYPIEFNPVTQTAIRQQQEIADTFLELNLIPRKITVTDIVWSQARA
ncbi:aliphatic sulfonate ABC transporter substrate-binding protein [Aquabacter cavernae]|uniref:aliphatic sulfonate ABC transporter substrate-binding protein n=1 Tax=Aquabacter cavernae TaxID=2496029 RepID=UPI000F8C9C8B|nr:aliphatic sulfonate ABC transporter substrate-binding protein [Aquabacter cavernae]